MIVGLHRDEDGDAEPDLVLVHDRDPLLDHAVGLEPLNPLPARRRGQADPLADLGDGQRGVLLQGQEDFAINGIHAAPGILF